METRRLTHKIMRSELWTEEQVQNLRAWQSCIWVHPFTCGNQDHPKHVNLIPTVLGWVCPDCDYRQDWAHGFMLDGSVVESMERFWQSLA